MVDLALSIPETRTLERAGLRLQICQPRRTVHLQIGAGESRDDVAAIVGGSLPDMGRWTPLAGGMWATIAPDEWIIIGCRDELPNRLKAELDGRLFLLVERTHELVTLELRGRDAEAALSACCPLDLRAESFPAGHVATSLVGEVVATILAYEAEGARWFEIMIEHTALPYLWHMLQIG